MNPSLPGTSGDSSHFRLDFPPAGLQSCVEAGRDFVEHALALRGPLPVDRTAVEDAALVAVELLANAVDHTPGPQHLDLDLDGDRVLIAVTDSSPCIPHLSVCHQPDQIRGHGLHIVDCLSRAWGCTVSTPDGKTVWALMPRD